MGSTDAISVLDAHWSFLALVTGQLVIQEGAVTKSLQEHVQKKLCFMEKILAIIAVSLGKKITVYAVGRVSTNDRNLTIEFRVFPNLL